MAELTDLLNNLSFPTQIRNNISKEKVEGFVLGYIIPRGKGRWKGTEPRLCSKCFAVEYREIYKKAKELISKELPDFEYTSIQVNKNVKCGKHIDRYNKKDSAIIGLGDYTEGELRIYDKKGGHDNINIKNNFHIFNGSNYHETLDWTGTRYSVVYFSVK